MLFIFCYLCLCIDIKLSVDNTSVFCFQNPLLFAGVNSNAVMMNDLALVKRSDDLSLPLVLNNFFESNTDSGNVQLLLDNNVRLTSHVCFLSSSPVLKNIFQNIEVRLEKTIPVSLPGWSQESVEKLVQFLHHGFVGKSHLNFIYNFFYSC